MSVLRSYFNDTTNIISDTVFINDHFLTLDSKNSKVVIQSFIENKTISFEVPLDSISKFQINPKELDKSLFFQKINAANGFEKVSDKQKSATFITKPIFSSDRNYSLVEIGNRTVFSLPKMITDKKRVDGISFDLMLYKKEKGIWKPLELIHRRNFRK